MVSLDKGGDAWDPDNLQALCRGCHVAKTAAENRRPLTPGGGRMALSRPRVCKRATRVTFLTRFTPSESGNQHDERATARRPAERDSIEAE